MSSQKKITFENNRSIHYMTSHQPAFFDLPFTIKDYSLTQTIGEGAFSQVFKGIKAGYTEFCAIKVIKKAGLRDQRDEQHLQNELDSMAFLKHDNIIALRDFFTDDDYFFIVMDYCEGGPLDDCIVQNGSLREPVAAGIFYQICSAIQFCHQRGVAHRDLKPPNILITSFPNIKVTDFGLAGFLNRDQKMTTFCGSPCYTAPECLKRIPYDGKLSDMWSLGVILYEMVTGNHPWHVNNIPKMIKEIQSAQYSLPPEISPACTNLIRDLLRVKPTERISFEKIFSHPWMRLVGTRAKSRAQNLPPLSQIPLSQVCSSIDRSKLKSDHGIVSPFDGSTPFIQSTMRRSISLGYEKTSLRNSANCLLKPRTMMGPNSATRKPLGKPQPKLLPAF